MAAVPTTAWHITMDINGEPYPTRHYAPDVEGTSDACFNLPPRQLDYLRAIHEAGHAVTALAGRAHLHYAQIVKGPATSTQGGVTDCCSRFADGQAFAVFSAAGERASDRWLREAGLWTPERAVAVEVGSHGDRHLFLSINPHVGFGDKQIDYRVLHDLADAALDKHWAATVRVADALAATGHLTGDDIATLADLPNGTHTAA
ncbi:hypothetical protein JBE04_17965 [Streptomyces sp. PRKS01-29]|nr:hypothetical protein [Streptomyces sabulosicollis]MBI0296298.1 hypothetical protein [Streptomyces sabulosicollis]